MLPTILITGGAGYIGSHTSWLMAQQGYNIIVIDDLLYEQEFKHPWAKFIKSDFANLQILNEIFTNNKIEVVIHFAAFIEVSESFKNPMKYYNNNVLKTLTLLEIMLKHNVKNFIFSSSCAVYGNPENIPIKEDHQRKPINVYGQTKFIIENVLKSYNDAYDLKYIILRYFNACGALPELGLGEQHKPETHIIPLLLEAIKFNKPFTINGTDHKTKDGTAIRDFIHVLDIADAHYLALKHLQTQNLSDIFNLGIGRGYSIKEIIQTAENLFKIKLIIINNKKRVGDPSTLIADPTKANTILKWKPKYSDLEFILKSAYAFN